jgi:hypothetical protein
VNTQFIFVYACHSYILRLYTNNSAVDGVILNKQKSFLVAVCVRKKC